MSKIAHADYWVRIPAGSFSTGVSESQAQQLVREFEQRMASLTRREQETLLTALKKDYELAATPEPQRSQLLELQRKLETPGTTEEDGESIRAEMRRIHDSMPPGQGRLPDVVSTEELLIAHRYRYKLKKLTLDQVANIEMSMLVPKLGPFPERAEVETREFYIARFPMTNDQYHEFTHGTSAPGLEGLPSESEPVTIAPAGGQLGGYLREAAPVLFDEAQRFVEDLGGRFPTSEEWEKAARGEDGRLYPWGDEWNPAAGYFYYGQDERGPDGRGGKIVDAFPAGVSPYGVWSMAGGLSELVMALPSQIDLALRPETDPQERKLGLKAVHARESSPEFAWLDHIVAWRGRGDWVSLRPVLDEWPVQSWPGVGPAAEEPQDPAKEAN